jgi:hypothetical protein
MCLCNGLKAEGAKLGDRIAAFEVLAEKKEKKKRKSFLVWIFRGSGLRQTA